MAEKAENKPVKEQVKENANQELFEALRKLRKQIADEESVPAYVVFSDATLNDMVLVKPINVGQMKTVQGVGQVKLEKYGTIFLKEIQNYLRNFKVPGTRLANGVTYLETLELYNKGLDIEEIAIARNLAPSTMVQHLIKLKSEGESIDLEKFISKSARKTILEIISELKLKLLENMKIQEILERVGEAIPAWQIRLILHVEFERKT
jgi:ATP-dependent DNA helicase RecQ